MKEELKDLVKIVCCALLLGACTAIDDLRDPVLEAELPILPTATMGELASGSGNESGQVTPGSRGSGNLSTGATFSVSVIRMDQGSESGTYPTGYPGITPLTGTANTAAGTLAFAQEQYYLSNGRSTRLIAFYPAISDASSQWDDGAGTVTYPLDGATDLMSTTWGEGNKVAAREGTQPTLTFQHLLAQLCVYVYAAGEQIPAQWGNVQQITLAGQPGSCSLMLPTTTSAAEATCTVAFSETANTDYPFTALDGTAVPPLSVTATTKETAQAFGYSLIPPTSSEIELVLSVQTALGGAQSVRLSPCRYEPGKAYSIYLRFNAVGGITASNVSITAWEDGDTLDEKEII